MGPFAGGMTASILPELGASFGVTSDIAATSIVTYMIPFASLMLISGKLGEVWGPKHTVTAAYLLFFAATLLCALAPNWAVFLAGFFICGVANAFTTPLLLATLGVSVPRERLGFALGLYGAMQGMGQLSAPLVSGIAASVDWRYAFAGVAAVSLTLALISIPANPPSGDRLRLRGLLSFSLPVWGFALVFFVLGIGIAGLGFLVALQAANAFGSSSSVRGLIVMSGGIASLLVSLGAGWFIDRVGGRRVMIIGLIAGGGTVALLPLAPSAALLALLWGLAMCWGHSVQISVNQQVLHVKDAGASISFVQAFRFFGAATAPVIILPIYTHSMNWGFWVSALIAVSVGIVAIWVRPRGESVP